MKTHLETFFNSSTIEFAGVKCNRDFLFQITLVLRSTQVTIEAHWIRVTAGKKRHSTLTQPTP